MKSLDEQLQQGGTQHRAEYSAERHDALVASLLKAPSRMDEPPLRGLRDFQFVGVSALVALISVIGVLLLNYQSTDVRRTGDFSAPMRVAENSIERLQEAASSISSDPSAPFFKQADDILTYFADQISLAESLAVTPQNKSRV